MTNLESKVKAIEIISNIFFKIFNYFKKWKYTTYIKVISMLWIIFFLVCPDKAMYPFDRFKEKRELSKHTKKIESRQQIDRITHNELDLLMRKLESKRIVWAETHNGSQNLNGFSFLYLSIKFELIDSYETIELFNMFQAVPMSKYPFIGYLIDNGIWVGKLSELEVIDNKIFYTLTNDRPEYAGCEYLAAIYMKDCHSLLMVNFEKKENMSVKQIEYMISETAKNIEFNILS